MSVDELMELARPLVTDGRVPSKSAIQKALRVRWDRVAEIHRDLAAEVEQGVRERQDRRRAMLAQRRARKTPGRQLTARVPALPAIPVSPGVVAVAVAGVAGVRGDLVGLGGPGWADRVR
jgi:hypothetical protein